MDAIRYPVNELITLNSKNPHSRGYHTDGVFLHKSLIEKNLIDSINDELNHVFRKPSFNQILNGSTWKNSSIKDVSLATSLNSVNIMELGVDLFHKLIPEESKEYSIITSIEIYSEISSKIVSWHSDQLKNIMKLNILLKGGGSDSGEFHYINRSNKINHNLSSSKIKNHNHHLNKNELDSISQFIRKFPALPGDVLQFDSYGFHYRGPCSKERRNIFIEIQDIRNNYPKRKFYIGNDLLSEKVCKNIGIFRLDSKAKYSYLYTHHTVIPVSLMVNIIIKFININFRKIISKIYIKK
uniref:hypothetical protein n=1 Tax=Polynucleobacter sp. TaxID=2029855 RepID=UPI004047A990